MEEQQKTDATEGLEGFYKYLTAAALIILVVVLVWHLSAYVLATQSDSLGETGQILLWMGVNSSEVAGPLGLVISPAVALAGAIVAIRLSNNALNLSKHATRQQIEGMRVDRRQKAIEICAMVSPVAAEAEMSARTLTRNLLGGLAKTSSLSAKLTNYFRGKKTDGELYCYVTIDDVAEAIDRIEAVEQIREMLIEISDSLFILSQTHYGPSDAPASNLKWKPSNSFLQSQFLAECERFKNGIDGLCSDVLRKLDHRVSAAVTAAEITNMSMAEISTYVREQAGELNTEVISAAFIEYIGQGPYFDYGKEIQSRLRVEQITENSQDKLLFFAALLGVERRTIGFGYATDRDTMDTGEVESVDYAVNVGISLLRRIFEELPTSENVQIEFSDLIASLIGEEGWSDPLNGKASEKSTILNEVNKFLRVHTLGHDRNHLAVRKPLAFLSNYMDKNEADMRAENEGIIVVSVEWREFC